MSRKTIVLISIIFIGLVIGGLFGFYFYLYNTNGGSTATSTSAGGFFSGLFNRKAPEPTAPATTTEEILIRNEVGEVVQQIPRLRKITAELTSGADFIIKDVYATTTPATTTKSQAPKVIGKAEVIRWLERGTGNIYETATSTLTKTRLSNTTAPQIEEAYFTGNGNAVITRKLVGTTDTVETRYGQLKPITATSTEQSLEFGTISTSISYIAISPDKTRMFSINPIGARGSIAKVDGSSKTTAFDSPFTEWLADWPSTNAIILTTKPSGTTDGLAYLLNPQTRAFTKILGNRKGLTVLVSPDTNKILFGEFAQGEYQLNVADRKTGAVRLLYMKTLPEKCVWSKIETSIVYCGIPTSLPFSTYPDTWYQGVVSFSDSLWRIDTNTGETRLIFGAFDSTDEALDMTYLTLSTKEDAILFRNKNDLSLWSYQLILSTTPLAPGAATSTASSTR